MNKFIGGYGKHFEPTLMYLEENLSLLNQPLKEIEQQHADDQFITDAMRTFVLVKKLSSLELDRAIDTRTDPSGDETNRNLGEIVLLAGMMRYFDAAQTYKLQGYFKLSEALCKSVKKRKMRKERKLNNFFGERLKENLLRTQLESATGQSGTEPLADGVKKVSPSPSIVDLRKNIKQKKKTKLEEFFGNKLPRGELRKQQLVAAPLPDENFRSISDKEVVYAAVLINAELPLPPTLNELDPAQKRLLTQRLRKIQAVLGTPLSEATNASNAIDFQIIIASPEIEKKYCDDKTRQKTMMGSPEGENVAPESRLDESTSSVSQSSTQGSVLRRKNEYRRKKLQKLQRFMGERFSWQTVVAQQRSAPYKITPEERQRIVKRVDKLGRYFGDLIPSELIATQKETTLIHKRSILGLAQIMQSKDDLAELVESLAVFEYEQATGLSRTASVGSLESLTPVNEDALKLSRQRRLQKLKKFFGYIPDLNLVQNILDDIEQSIDEEIQEMNDKNALKYDLKALKEQIHRQSLNSVPASDTPEPFLNVESPCRISSVTKCEASTIYARARPQPTDSSNAEDKGNELEEEKEGSGDEDEDEDEDVGIEDKLGKWAEDDEERREDSDLDGRSVSKE